MNASKGKTLIVDGSNPECYPVPSAALRDAGEHDQIEIRPGVYEDKLFVSDRPIRLLGAGRDLVQIFYRRGGPLYLQRVTGGRISGITFRYVGSDQHSAINALDSTCTIAECRAIDGVLSGVVLYGPECRLTFSGNEVCRNRESGIFVFAGAHPRVADNHCFDNHHFGIAVRDEGTCPDLVRNICERNLLSGLLLFHHAGALLADNLCRDNEHWGMVFTPDAYPNPAPPSVATMNKLELNPRGAYRITDTPLTEIGR